MSFVPIIVSTGAAARRRRRRREKEEEQMSGYRKEDLEGWEFKIVRSATGQFRKLEVVRQLCEEESRAGWEMLEKFDDFRIRFKRRIEKRSMDSHLSINAYRTTYGSSFNPIILALILGMVLVVGGIALFTTSGTGQPRYLVLSVIIILAIVMALVIVASRRTRR
jgi:hypothetical protein